MKLHIPNFEEVCEFAEVQYGEVPPDPAGKNVYVLDFSYTPAQLKEHFGNVESIEMLDHHESAFYEHLLFQESDGSPSSLSAEKIEKIKKTHTLTDTKDFSYVLTMEDGSARRANVLFSAVNSGAGLSLKQVHRIFGDSRSWGGISDLQYWRLHNWVERIEDRDLWVFQYPDSNLVYELLSSVPRTFEAWDALLCLSADEYSNTLAMTAPLVAMRGEIARQLAAKSEPIRVFDYSGVAVNAPHVMASDVGQLLYDKYDFCLSYEIDSKEAVLSFRSKKGNDIDVAAIAKRLGGGGGHSVAAGARIPTDQFVTRLATWRRTAVLKSGPLRLSL
jgi:hypothetical protein